MLRWCKSFPCWLTSTLEEESTWWGICRFKFVIVVLSCQSISCCSLGKRKRIKIHAKWSSSNPSTCCIILCRFRYKGYRQINAILSNIELPDRFVEYRSLVWNAKKEFRRVAHKSFYLQMLVIYVEGWIAVICRPQSATILIIVSCYIEGLLNMPRLLCIISWLISSSSWEKPGYRALCCKNCFRSVSCPGKTSVKRLVALEGDWIASPDEYGVQQIPKVFHLHQ